LGEKMLNKGNCMIVETFKTDHELDIAALADEVHKLNKEIKTLLSEKGERELMINKKIEAFETKYTEAEVDMFSKYLNGEGDYEATEPMTVYANAIELLKQIKN